MRFLIGDALIDVIKDTMINNIFVTAKITACLSVLMPSAYVYVAVRMYLYYNYQGSEVFSWA